MTPKIGAKMVLKWSPEVVKVFTYAAAKSEHFRAFALYFWKRLVGPKWVRNRWIPKWISKWIPKWMPALIPSLIPKWIPNWSPKWIPKCFPKWIAKWIPKEFQKGF